ncbi:hypothetical protein BDV10DRAFT_9937 [Aspergillus recurvatus]
MAAAEVGGTRETEISRLSGLCSHRFREFSEATDLGKEDRAGVIAWYVNVLGVRKWTKSTWEEMTGGARLTGSGLLNHSFHASASARASSDKCIECCWLPVTTVNTTCAAKVKDMVIKILTKLRNGCDEYAHPDNGECCSFSVFIRGRIDR